MFTDIVDSLCAVIATWLNASQRYRVGVGINTEWNVNRFERSYGLDTAIYVPLLYFNLPRMSHFQTVKRHLSSFCLTMLLKSSIRCLLTVSGKRCYCSSNFPRLLISFCLMVGVAT